MSRGGCFLRRRRRQRRQPAAAAAAAAATFWRMTMIVSFAALLLSATTVVNAFTVETIIIPKTTTKTTTRTRAAAAAAAASAASAPFSLTCRSLSSPMPSWRKPPLTSSLTRTTTSKSTSSASSTTSLSMGVIEDFLTGRDSELRRAEDESYLKRLSERVDRINGLEETIEELEDDELEAKTAEFKSRLAAGEDMNGPLLEEAFAVVREAAWRVLELRHYDVQLLAGLVLHDGKLAEMATGEGKTLAATAPCYLNALSGRPAFVVTVNDYLARRDAERMGQVHRFLGLSVGLIQSDMREGERVRQYGRDVVYVTNSELGFDYLRDHLALSREQTVLLPTAAASSSAVKSAKSEDTAGEEDAAAREFDGFCVVDEADSVLIDEARTPLIISKQVPAAANKYATANQLAAALKRDLHYTVDLKNKNAVLNELGYRDAERALGVDSLFTIQADGTAWAPYVSNAVKAKELFRVDQEYAVLPDDVTGKPAAVGIIDSFTGRVLSGRRWSDGLHQSIEAKEGIAVSEQSKVIAKVTYQSLFRQFSRLSGMTGTAAADATELEETYGLRVVTVPTALPVARRDYPDVAFKTRAAANAALVREVANVGGGEDTGRPCLIGTTSVRQSEEVVAALADAGIAAELLNASPKNAPRESEIVAQAGRAGVVTVATNMAGRGTDILLGGCPTTMARIKTRSVLLEEGILSDPAETASLPPSPAEEYFPCPISNDAAIMLQEAATAIRDARGDELTGIEVDEILTVAFDTTESEDDPAYISKLRDAAAAIKETYAAVLDDEKVAVKSAGGLYVMGTNRHESSRIDQQLRGRAGRQGDPGSSRFFLSFEDDMFVIFGGDAVSNILTMFRVSEDMPVEAPAVTEALDKVQSQVEEKYRDIRREIFNFDEVLNAQRRVIYARRRRMLFHTDEAAFHVMEDYNRRTVRDLVKAQTTTTGTQPKETVNVIKLLEKVEQFFPPVRLLVQEDDLVNCKDAAQVTAFLTVAVEESFTQQATALDTKAAAAGKPIHSLGRSARYITLVTMDNAWSDHLQAMENLKETVLLRQYQGRDPVAEYRNEAFQLFQGLEDTMRCNAVFSLWQSLAATSSSAEQQQQLSSPTAAAA